MPVTLPQRRPARLNRWHLIGVATAYVATVLVLLWFAFEPIRSNDAVDTIQVTTGIAPADQSGRPLQSEGPQEIGSVHLRSEPKSSSRHQ
jgi:hypothetical protein